MAFSQNLQKRTINTRLFRKVSGGNFLKDGEHCFSTESSSMLISRGDFCFVLVEKEYSGMYDSQDADAGRNFGYDEFRVKMSKENLVQQIEAIVVPNWWGKDIDEDLYDTEDDPMVWMDNLSNYGKVIFEKDFQTTVNFNF